MDDATIEKASRVLEELEKTHLKFQEQLDTLKAYLAEGPTPSQQAKKLVDLWFTLWGERYKARCIVNGPRDTKGFKTLLKSLDAAEVERRLKRYLADNEPWLINGKHPLPVFFSQPNRWSAAQFTAAEEVYTPVGCRHTPPCTTDVQHTRRCNAERRSVPQLTR